MDIREAVKKGHLFLDGAMGTELYKRGLQGDTSLVNLNAPDVVEEIQRAYIQAGANIITANTFAAYKHKQENADTLIRAAFDIAKKARDEKKIYIAMDMGATGMMLEPYGDISIEECQKEFAEAVQVGAECGADLVIIETMMDLSELKAALNATLETGLPIIATMSFNENGRTMYGTTIKEMAEALDHPNVIAVGMNCGFGPKAYMPLIDELKKHTNKPIVMQPNAGLPFVDENGVPSYDLSPEDFADLMVEAAKKGVHILGGCCGTSPAHILAMVNAL
ncbi:MAG: homocysteine S-methyltransferase family protein [Defluviitaleaceae bacterium]|nr:homocysteine S-methyltransferase family protein [Defluviitaleaceae bacterium]